MDYKIMILIALLSYGVGNINPAILIGKLTRGIDIREYNSKNAGTSNVVMTVGYRWGIFSGIIDILKGFIPVLIIRLIFPENDIYWLFGGFSAIMGHIYPLYYKFKGGKGTATFGGVLFAINPLLALGLLIVFIIVLYYTDYIALSTLSAIVITPIAMYFLGFYYMSIFIITIYSLVSFYKHFENYKRIYKGEELGLRRFNRNKDKVRAK
jgi:glycerol-3-phosphate acyltransferase PlsY